MIRLITVFLALALATPFAAAEDDITDAAPKPRRYAVEVIVFAYAENFAVGTEIFPPDEPAVSDDEIVLEELLTGEDGIAIDANGDPVPVFSDTAAAAGDADELLEGVAEEEGPELLPIEPVLMIADDFSLQRAREQLERLDAYEPILHTAWTQATLPLEESIALELEYFGDVPEGLDGSFMLYLGRYLHLVVDLTLDAATDAAAATNYDEPVVMFGDERAQYDLDLQPDAGGVYYRIQEDRIVKNGDVRYFDHPRFGVVAKVTRIEEPEEDPESEAAAESAPLAANPVQ